MNYRAVLLFLFLPLILSAQTYSEVEARGKGITRNAAISDALRQAIAQTCGVLVQSSTKVENYVTLEDAIVTRTNGYIQNYSVITEEKKGDEFDVTVKANVSVEPLKQDVTVLSQFVSSLRFMVLFDDRKLSTEDHLYLSYAYSRLNEKLLESKLRYVEAEKLNHVKVQTAKSLAGDTAASAYVEKLGMYADAEFLLLIKKINVRSDEKMNGLYSSKVTIEVTAFDNCTGEGLASLVLEGDWKTLPDKNQSAKAAINSAVEKGFSSLIQSFTTRVAGWINGAPYQLRFYGIKSPKTLLPLLQHLQLDSEFGGEMEQLLSQEYIRIDLTYKGKPMLMYEKLMNYIEQVPELKKLNLDVKLFYGRQLSLAPLTQPAPKKK